MAQDSRIYLNWLTPSESTRLTLISARHGAASRSSNNGGYTSISFTANGEETDSTGHRTKSSTVVTRTQPTGTEKTCSTDSWKRTKWSPPSLMATSVSTPETKPTFGT